MVTPYVLDANHAAGDSRWHGMRPVSIDRSKGVVLSFDGVVSAEDWGVLLSARPNILVVGPDQELARVLDALLPAFQPPITRSTGGRLTLPAQPGGTLILQDASDLSIGDQQRMVEWLFEADRSTQVITTASSSLFPLVEQKLFLDGLYYRLNVMCLAFEPAFEVHN